VRLIFSESWQASARLGSHQEQDPASSDEEALNEILAQRESLKRQSSETLTASEAPPLPPPVPPRVQEVAQRAAHSTRTASEALPLPPPILPHVRGVAQRATRSSYKQEDSNTVEEPRSPAPRRLPPKFSSRARKTVSSPHNDRQTLSQEYPPSPSRRQPRKPTSRASTSVRRK
jgi:hypothetical protein